MKRAELIYRNSLRPGLVLNISLLGVLLALFGFAHTWLGMRLQEKDKSRRALEEQVTQLGNEIRRLEVDVNHLLSNGALVSRMHEKDVRLRLINPGEVITLDVPPTAN